MKKLFIGLTLLATTFAATAQDAAPVVAGTPITSKRGFPILPEAGDYSISFDALPLFQFVGNAFSSSGTNSVSAAFPSSNTITVRKFIDANTAYRGMVRFDLGSTTSKFNSANAASTDPLATVEDKFAAKNTDVTIGGGLEKRRGTGRVQGIYGAMASIGISGSKNKYTYGNNITTATPNPAAHNFNGNINGAVRTTEAKTSSGFNFGIVGFVGAEYFIAPKLSVGAEFQWGPSISTNGKLETTTETYDGATNAVKSTTTTTAGGSSLGFSTVVSYINLNFFF
jgi:hypothetical protein